MERIGAIAGVALAWMSEPAFAASGELARTGARISLGIVLLGVLMLMGLILLLASRRRRATGHRAAEE